MYLILNLTLKEVEVIAEKAKNNSSLIDAMDIYFLDMIQEFFLAKEWYKKLIILDNYVLYY